MIRPIYIDENGLAALGPEDFQKVVAGYGCPRCWEDYNGVYHVTCPVCSYTRDLAEDIKPTPRHWLPSPPDQDVVTVPDDPFYNADRGKIETAWDEVQAWNRKKRGY